MGWETDNWKSPSASDLSRPNYMGPRPNPSPHMSGHVPPAPSPHGAQQNIVLPLPTSPLNIARPSSTVGRPSVPQTLRQSASSFAMIGAVLFALYAWFGVHAAVPMIAGYAVAGGLLGAVAAVALAAAVFVLELAIKIFIFCLKGGLVIGLIYFVLRSFGHVA